MNKPAFWLAVAAGLTLTACSTILNNLPGVYTLDIEQGNMIDQGMIDQLRPNMTKRQVLYIMGSPMLADSFHEKRWDYLYSKQPGGEDRVQKRVSLFFNGDNLIGMQGDFRPSSLPVVKEASETSVELPKRDLEKSMWEKITGLFSDEPVATTRETPAGKSSSGNVADKESAAAGTDASRQNSEKSLWDSITDLFSGEPDATARQTHSEQQSPSDAAGKEPPSEKTGQ